MEMETGGSGVRIGERAVGGDGHQAKLRKKWLSWLHEDPLVRRHCVSNPQKPLRHPVISTDCVPSRP